MDARNQRINVKLYEIDDFFFKNCTDIESLPQLMRHEHIQAFIQNEITQINADNCTKVIIANGSAQDKYAYDKHPVRVLALPILQHYFQQHLYCETVFDPLWMVDIYSPGKKAGESFKAALLYKNSSEQQHNRSVIDQSRVTNIYVHAHRAAALHPGAQKIVIDYAYDLSPRLFSLSQFFNQYPLLLPKNVTLRLRQLNENNLCTQFESIDGTGEIDPNYEWSVRYLASLYYFVNGQVANNAVKISDFNELANYYFENSYQNPNHNIQMDINLKYFRLTLFLSFRDHQIHKSPNIAELRILGSTANYSTAVAYYAAGLLPILPQDEKPSASLPEENDVVIDNPSNPPPTTVSLRKQLNESPIEYVVLDDYQKSAEATQGSPSPSDSEEIFYACSDEEVESIESDSSQFEDTVFNTLQTIKNIANLPLWEKEGSGLLLFSSKIPDGITDIRTTNPTSLQGLIKLINVKSSNSFRSTMTTEFYNMILTLSDNDENKQFDAINKFCDKWQLSNDVLHYDMEKIAIPCSLGRPR